MSKARAKGFGSHSVGIVGEAHFLEFAAGQQWQIFRGMAGHEPYDYIVDTGERLLRVEVKRAVSLKDRRYDPIGKDYVAVTKLKNVEFDYLFVSTPQGNYWIPTDVCPKDMISITSTGRSKWEAFRV